MSDEAMNFLEPADRQRLFSQGITDRSSKPKQAVKESSRMELNKGRSWIWIRGLGRHSLHWGPFLDRFKMHFPNDGIECLDLRGNGRLAHSPSYLSIADNVRDLRARSQFLKTQGPVYLLTISLGSMVGVEWAHQHPQEIAGLVTINTSDRGSSSFLQRMRPRNYLPLLKALAHSPQPLEVEKMILQLTAPHLTDLEAQAHTFAQAPRLSRGHFLRQLMAAGTYEFPKTKPKTEILLLCSQGDTFVHPDCTHQIAQMWTLKEHVHPSAGHDLPLEDPDWICQEIKNWLA